MSASTDKKLQLVEALAKATKRGDITWEETAEENCFMCTFINHCVMIRASDNGLGSDLVPGAPTIKLRITDDVAFVLESFDSVQVKTNQFLFLFNDAKRQALGAEKAIDSILVQL